GLWTKTLTPAWASATPRLPGRSGRPSERPSRSDTRHPDAAARSRCIVGSWLYQQYCARGDPGKQERRPELSSGERGFRAATLLRTDATLTATHQWSISDGRVRRPAVRPCTLQPAAAGRRLGRPRRGHRPAHRRAACRRGLPVPLLRDAPEEAGGAGRLAVPHRAGQRVAPGDTRTLRAGD